MRWISDPTLAALRRAVDQPDLEGSRYEIEGEIGRGGMGTVYLARDRDLDRRVALKVLSLSQGGEEAARRLKREARILAHLEHPGIVPIHELLILPDGRVAYAMKLVEGKRLDHHVTADTPLGERLRIFSRIAETVAFAHANGVVHRDLKPANVMVGAFGEVLILDWGVAKLLQPEVPEIEVPGTFSPPEVEVPGTSSAASGAAPEAPEALGATAHGTVLGTPGYMAPEQERGEVTTIDERTDVWALGAILHFLLAGVPPRPEVIPKPLAAVCVRALAAKPAERYQRVEDLAADVARFTEGLAVSAYPEGLLGKAGRFVRRYRTPILLILAYLLMRILLFVFPPG